MKPGCITIADGQLNIRCAPHVAIKLQRLFAGSRRLEAGVFSVKATPGNAHELEWFRQRYPLDIDPTSEVAYRNLVDHEDRRMASIAEIERETYVPREYQMAVPPREYQRLAADLALRTRGLLIADQMGTGKTCTAICTLVAPGSLPAVVVTMTYLPRQWQAQLAKFAPDLTTHIVKTRKPYRFDKPRFETDRLGRRRKVPGYVPDVIVLSYSKIDGWVEQLSGLCKTIVFDEIQELRHSDTNRYQAAKAIAETCDLRVGLSGTPVYNYGDEIWPVLNVTSPDILGSREEFLREWCNAGHKHHPVRDPVALGTYLRASGAMIRRTRKDVGRELPGLTTVRLHVEVDHSRINEAVQSVAELAQRVLARSGTNFELMKWSGELDWRLRQATGIGKAAAVVDHVRLLVESGETVLLLGWHHECYALWGSAFDKHGVTCAMYTGAESEPQKIESVRRFMAGEAKVMVMSLRSGAGLDGLQAVCHTVVVGELDWSPKVIEQDICRVYRDGQELPCTVYYCIADSGSDPVIADVLGIKDAQATGITDPDTAGEVVLTGASEDHMRKLASEVLLRVGLHASNVIQDDHGDEDEHPKLGLL